MKKLKLLAPAGSMEALYAAVENGADEIYLGGSEFSARSSAQNFTDSQLCQAVKYAKPRGVNIFLALNTLIYQDELCKVGELIATAYEAGVDALIVQDLAVAKLAEKIAPGMHLHASTQMTLHNFEGVNFIKNCGFDRVVLSREMQSEQIKYICENCDVETEIFVHGALCMCYSGKCLMSSMIGGRSGNRGACAQPCRQAYTVNGKRGYYLNLRDLCLIDEIPKIQKMGVTSVKIEGRMKSPEYVATVTALYRKAIDGGVITDEDRHALTEIFSRGGKFTKGFFAGKDERDMIIPNISNDKTGKNISKQVLDRAKNSYKQNNRKTPVDMEFCGGTLTIKNDDFSVDLKCESEDVPQLSKERIKEQLLKLGTSPFYARSIKVADGYNIKISEINSIRRQAVDTMILKMTGERKSREFENADTRGNCTPNKFDLCVCASNITQARAAANSKIKRIYLDINEFENIENADMYAVLPTIINGDLSDLISNAVLKGCKGFVCNSTEGIAAVKNTDREIIGGMGLNITNLLSLDFWKRNGLASATLSPEMQLKRIREAENANILPIEVMVYGRYPLMLTKSCIIKSSVGKCTCKTFLKDKTGAVFPVIKRGADCGNIILNSVPLYIADKPQLLKGNHIGQIHFTTESEAECKDIINRYRKNEPFDKEYTRGYFNK